ncbi:hypothetical protein EPN95_00795 [Patescibacteria group bacterium]|nr:MAG: hypothetical protein EPN95_00795 [Patescibacteria group bacterium]
MWNKLIKSTFLKYIIAVLATFLVAYLVLAPLLIKGAFPQYTLVKKYISIEVCTDLAPSTPSKVFLPISCASLGSLNKLGCTYSNARYAAPAAPTSDEKTVCPTLVSATDATGAKNPALASLPTSENALRNILVLAMFIIVAGIYILIRVLRHRIVQKKNQLATEVVQKT